MAATTPATAGSRAVVSTHKRRILSYMLTSVSPEGCWGTSDYDEWAPIITAMTVELLLDYGVMLDSPWYVTQGGAIRQQTLRQSIAYLNACIRDDGSFGEDLWDATRLGKIIARYDLAAEFSKYEGLTTYLDRQMDRKGHRERSKTWSGPGYLCALIDYCTHSGKGQLEETLFLELQSLQNETGEFRGAAGADGNELASPVWHTAQALLCYLNRGLTERDPRVRKMVTWLQKTQTDAGNWPAFSRYDVYFTSYAVMALSKLGDPPQDTLQRAIDWLKGRVAPSGKVADAGGTLMAAIALTFVEGRRLDSNITVFDLHNAEVVQKVLSGMHKEIAEKNSELAAAEEELSQLRERYKDADVVFSKRQVFILGFVLAVVGIAVSVVTYFLSTAGQPASPQAPTPSINQPAPPG